MDVRKSIENAFMAGVEWADDNPVEEIALKERKKAENAAKEYANSHSPASSEGEGASEYS